MLLRWALTAILMLLWSAATAQESAAEEYRVRVTTKSGNHIRGILNEVTDEYLYVGYLDSRPHHRSEKIPLRVIHKAVIRYKRSKHTLEGAVVGVGLAAFLTIQSSNRNGFRSPVVYGLNLVIAAGAGAAIGAIIGRNIGSISRRTIRPIGQTPDEAAESLRRQLKPFTYEYQNDILNRVPQ